MVMPGRKVAFGEIRTMGFGISQAKIKISYELRKID
jgi:hypothetical protein